MSQLRSSWPKRWVPQVDLCSCLEGWNICLKYAVLYWKVWCDSHIVCLHLSYFLRKTILQELLHRPRWENVDILRNFGPFPGISSNLCQLERSEEPEADTAHHRDRERPSSFPIEEKPSCRRVVDVQLAVSKAQTDIRISVYMCITEFVFEILTF